MLSFKKTFGAFVAVLFFIFLSQIASSATFNKKLPLEVVFLNVGQGDAILIDYLSRYQILIDGGPSGKVLMNELWKVMPKDDKEVEIVILTHPDWDHFGGLVDLLDYYSVGKFLTSDIENDKESFQKLVDKIQDRKIEIEIPENGSSIDVGEYLDLEILSPDSDNLFKDTNDNSVVARLDFGENSFLFTGDASEKTENFLMKEEGILLNVDWLKVAHHGSKNSTSAKFLEKVTPKFTVISVGENSYGHPAPELLERISRVEGEILRTDEQGTIIIECKTPQKESCKINN